MKKKYNNPYLYAGLTAVAVIAVAMLMIFVVFQRKELAEGLNVILTILQPFFIGGVLAYLLAPLCNRLERLTKKILPNKPAWQRLSNGLSVFISALTAVAIIAIMGLLIVPATFKSLMALIVSLPNYIMNLIDWSHDKLSDYPQAEKYIMNGFDAVYDKFEEWTQQQLMPSMQTVLNGLGSSIGIALKLILNVIVGFIVSIYLLFSRKTFARQGQMALYAAFPSQVADKVYDEVLFADKMFSGFLRGKVLDSAIVGLICFIATTIMQVEDAVLISVIIGVTNIIPFFGPFIGAVPSALLIFVSDPKKLIPFIIFLIILQQFDGNILGPKCMGNNVNLSAFWILFAILVFGDLFGFVGMIIGVPLFAVLYDILKKLIYYKLKKHGKEELVPYSMQDDNQQDSNKSIIKIGDDTENADTKA